MATAQNGARGIRVQVQRFGSFLSGMVMPNIGAFGSSRHSSSRLDGHRIRNSGNLSVRQSPISYRC